MFVCLSDLPPPAESIGMMLFCTKTITASLAHIHAHATLNPQTRWKIKNKDIANIYPETLESQLITSKLCVHTERA